MISSLLSMNFVLQLGNYVSSPFIIFFFYLVKKSSILVTRENVHVLFLARKVCVLWEISVVFREAEEKSRGHLICKLKREKTPRRHNLINSAYHLIFVEIFSVNTCR